MFNIRIAALALIAGLPALSAAPAQAGATLEITPVVLDIAEPSASGTVTLKNDDLRPTTIQVRLFKWRQVDGEEKYEPTQDVVASPPIGTIAPGASLTVRVIRSAQTPVQGEDSYRLVLDQLPQADHAGHAKVSLLLRQVLPVFFSTGERSPPKIAWSVAHGPRGLELRAHNEGDQRLRVANVTLMGSGGGSVKLGGTLLGYVLSHADMSWTITKPGSFRPGPVVAVRAQSDHGEISANAPVTAAR